MMATPWLDAATHNLVGAQRANLVEEVNEPVAIGPQRTAICRRSAINSDVRRRPSSVPRFGKKNQRQKQTNPTGLRVAPARRQCPGTSARGRGGD